MISNDAFSVAGNLTYLGGGGVDTINFKTEGATIGGYTYIDIATATSDARQNVLLTGGYSTSSLVVDGGTAVLGNHFETDASTLVSDGLVVVNFSESTADNSAVFLGTYGSYATYRGGSGADVVTLGASAIGGEFAAITGGGDDQIFVRTTTDLDFLFADFGTGVGNFVDDFEDGLPFDNLIVGL